jgi:hypothetical protein
MITIIHSDINVNALSLGKGNESGNSFYYFSLTVVIEL